MWRDIVSNTTLLFLHLLDFCRNSLLIYSMIFALSMRNQMSIIKIPFLNLLIMWHACEHPLSWNYLSYDVFCKVRSKNTTKPSNRIRGRSLYAWDNAVWICVRNMWLCPYITFIALTAFPSLLKPTGVYMYMHGIMHFGFVFIRHVCMWLCLYITFIALTAFPSKLKPAVTNCINFKWHLLL